jgi:alpha-glucosidase
MRWCELGAFTAAYRTHLGSQPHVNSQVLSSNATLNQWVKFSLVFRALYFYRLQLMQEAATQGIPLLRPMAVQFPLHEMVWEAAEQMKLQFMFGDTFLIAPVTAPAAIDVLVWFPKGYNWVHVWSDDSVTGNNQWQWIHAPLGEPAVFYACPIVGVSSTSETCNRGKLFVEELKKYGLR